MLAAHSALIVIMINLDLLLRSNSAFFSFFFFYTRGAYLHAEKRHLNIYKHTQKGFISIAWETTA